MTTDKVVVRIMNFEINITVNVVRKETHTAFKGHHFCRERKKSYFFGNKRFSCRSKETSYILLVKTEVKRNLGNILFILSGSVCTETYSITEIIEAESRHNSIKVNDTNRLICCFIKQYVIELCIIMSYS